MNERKEKFTFFTLNKLVNLKQKFNKVLYCKNCYDNEIDEEKYRILYGRYKGCSQIMKIQY